MLLGKRFQSFVDGSPVSVMVRGVLERTFDPARLDALFQKTAQSGYTRELPLSTAVGLMSEVVLGVSPSVHAAYQDASSAVPVSITAVYDKLKGIQTAVSAELVRDCARPLAPIIGLMRGKSPPLLPGYRVRILDGNHLAGTEHRVKELRRLRAAALARPNAGGPGPGMVVDHRRSALRGRPRPGTVDVRRGAADGQARRSLDRRSQLLPHGACLRRCASGRGLPGPATRIDPALGIGGKAASPGTHGDGQGVGTDGAYGGPGNG